MTGNSAERHHYLIGSSGTLIPIPTDRHIFLGRDTGNTVVVSDSRASRRHAEMWWDGANYIISDLESANGTFVNGEPVRTVTLSEGDIIQVGLQAFIYRTASSAAELQEMRSSIKQAYRKRETQEMAAVRPDVPDSDFHGALESMPLPELCQIFMHARRTGRLLIRGRNARAELHFADGALVYALFGELTGDEAAFGALAQRSGVFAFKNDQEPAGRNMHTRTEKLLLEAARRQDESNGSPPSNSTVRIR